MRFGAFLVPSRSSTLASTLSSIPVGRVVTLTPLWDLEVGMFLACMTTHLSDPSCKPLGTVRLSRTFETPSVQHAKSRTTNPHIGFLAWYVARLHVNACPEIVNRIAIFSTISAGTDHSWQSLTEE